MYLSISTSPKEPTVNCNYILHRFNPYFIDMEDKSNNQYNYEQVKTYYVIERTRRNMDNAIVRQSTNMFRQIKKKNCIRRCKNKYR